MTEIYVARFALLYTEWSTMFSGIIIVDKPAGWTSHDVIAKLRGVLKQKRIGHGGTLDPMATGVLPVFIGRGTRAAEFCENAEKEYIAELKLGVVTDTQDITGNVLSENDVNVTYSDLCNVLPLFRGSQKQIPPMYSAIKKDGRKLYELARKGIDVPREARDVNISLLELLDQSDELKANHTYRFRVACSKGTYIRTLCHDIGAMLGCGGTLSALQRTRAGVYTIEMSHSLECIIDAVQNGSNQNPNSTSNATKPDTKPDFLLSVDSIFSDYPQTSLDEPESRKAKNGAIVQAHGDNKDGRYRVYAYNGEFLLLGDVKGDKVKTIKSFFEV